MILLPVCAAAQAPTKRVLILSGSNPNYPGFSILVAAFVIEALLIAWLLFTRARDRQAMVQLDKRVRFETLLSKLSAEFADLPTSKVDTVVKQWLDRLKDFLGEVTILFFEVPGSEGAVNIIPSEDRSPLPRALAVNDVKDDEWCLDQLRKGNTIKLANVPAASSSEKTREIRSADLKYLLAIPFAVNGSSSMKTKPDGTIAAGS